MLTCKPICQIDTQHPQFSGERSLRFLVAFGQDVEIVVRWHKGSRRAPQLRVTNAAVGSTA